MDEFTKVCALVDGKREEAIEFLRELVKVNTSVVNQGEYGHEGSAQPMVAERLRRIGCSVDVFEPDNERLKRYVVDFNPGRNYSGRPNVVGVLKGQGGGRSLILNGHIDTVPYDETEWSVPPLSGEIRNGRMFGRGTADMKSGLAAMIMAVETIVEAGVGLRGDVIVQSVVDEEGGGNGTLACVDRGYTADAAIITEGTDEKIVVANRGVLNVEITVKGRAAHAAQKWAGINAVEKAMKIVAGLLELEKSWLVHKKHSLLPSPTITVGQIEGGIGATVVPDLCALKIDVKFLPQELAEDKSAALVKREFEDYVRLIASGDEWLRDNMPTIRWYSEVMPYELRPEDDFPIRLKGVLDRMGLESNFVGMPGGSDARILYNVGGIPTVLFGPSGEKAHGADENVDLESYIRTIKSLACMILDHCGRV